MPNPDSNEQIGAYLDRKTTQIQDFIRKKERLIELLEEEKCNIINNAVTKGINPNIKKHNSRIEWIGEYPKHWKILKLRFVGSCKNGISIGGEKFGKGCPFVSYSDVYNNYSLPKDVNGLVEATKQDQINYSVLEGDVFFTRTSETIEEIGFASTCMQTINEAVFAGFLIRFRPKKNTLFKNYSKYFFRATIHRAYFVKEVDLVTRASLGQNLLKGLPITLPPLAEQKEISFFLDFELAKREKLINKARTEIEKIKEYQESLITNIVTGKLKAPCHSPDRQELLRMTKYEQ